MVKSILLLQGLNCNVVHSCIYISFRLIPLFDFYFLFNLRSHHSIMNVDSHMFVFVVKLNINLISIYH